MSTGLVKYLSEYLNEWNNPCLLQEIFRTADPHTIAQMIEAFCLLELDSPLKETLFFEASQGAVFGLCLSNRERIVIKAHPPRKSVDTLSAVVQVQSYLAEHGYPCPTPLLAPRPLAAGHAVVETLIDEGIYKDAHDPIVRRSIAEMLAWHLNLTRHPESIPNVNPFALDLRLPPDILWPIPHNAIFNFEATTIGAEWIDELAQQAKETLANSAGQFVLGHTDWSVKHFRYIDGNVRVIYDWDSLAYDKEPVIVGGAARGFTYTEFLAVPWIPTQQEASAFVAEYEVARGRPFSTDERNTLAAAATYALAYSARCEHSLHPQEHTYSPRSYRATLAHYKDTFLNLEARHEPHNPL